MKLFLNVRNGTDVAVDPDGQNFNTIPEAEQEAIASARDLMADALRSGQPIGADREIEVTDEKGVVVLTVKFRDAMS